MTARIEVAVAVTLAAFVVGSSLLARHRSAVKYEYMSSCVTEQSTDQCQAQWWKSPIRSGWTTDDLWACWAGNPDTCAESTARAREQTGAATPPEAE